MSSSLPDIPSILYCGIGESTRESREQLLRSETLEAALTRLITTTGIIHTVAYREHFANRQYYIINYSSCWVESNFVGGFRNSFVVGTKIVLSVG